MNRIKTATSSKRILAIDILRGITIAGMTMVNNPGSWGHIYAPLRHAQWNGLTPTDLVFPFFMFIMGISTYISLKKYDFTFSRAAALKIIRRTAVIFLIGLGLGWFGSFCFYWASPTEGIGFWAQLGESVWTFDHIRILGVMQRLALCYCAAALVALTMKHSRIPWLIVALLVGYFVLLALGNGFVYGEENILSKVDRAILTPAHMYRDNGIEPEGILSTIPAIAHVLIGFCVARIMLGGKPQAAGDVPAERRHDQKLIALFLVGVILTFAGLLLSYGCPINKKVWSPTFVLATCGFGSSLLALLIWIIDVKGCKKWSMFFEAFGVNPLFMYVLGNVLSVLFDAISLPWGDGSVSIHGLLYDVTLQPLFGNTGGSLAYALVFIAINWVIGYQLYKRRIYIKI